MVPFRYLRATDTAHALSLLAEHGPGARLLAGGTDLLAELKTAERGPKVVIDIAGLAALRGIAVTEVGLRLGALATHSEIAESAEVRALCPALADAARAIGAVQTRNLGTIGGNLMTAVPSLDSGPVLLALDAVVTIAGLRGIRQLPLERMFVGPRRTALAPDELLIEVTVPRRHFGKHGAFRKLGLRKGQALALVNVAVAFRMHDGAFDEPGIALGAVAPSVMRAQAAETFLQGRPIDDAAMTEAGRIAAEEARPIDDFRASADYRRAMIAVLVRRALKAAATGDGSAACAR